MPQETVYDAVNVGSIPAGWSGLILVYIDGQFQTEAEALKDFPNARLVEITVLGRGNTKVCDCETGDLTPDSAAQWAAKEFVAGRRWTIYCNVSTHQAVVDALAVFHLEFERDGDWFSADWTGTAHLTPGASVTQWANPTLDHEQYDISLTDGVWPGTSVGPTPDPAPGPAPSPTGGFMPPTLKRGDLSGSVRSMQRLLNGMNQNLAVDGDFGPASETALENVQRFFGITVDGICGPHSWTVLDTFG